MDILVVLIILGSGVVVLIGTVLFFLNRSWGDFPSTPDYSALTQQPQRLAKRLATYQEPVVEPEPEPTEERVYPWLQNSHQASQLRAEPVEQDVDYMLIHSSLLLQIIDRAEARGNHRIMQHIVRDGEHTYLSLESISNPVQRQQMADMLAAFQSGQHTSVWDMLKLMSMVGRSK
ncbi:MAG: hypothetical protein HC876_03150 [Chloroflexaceae bacterium]|nr:hypothetical protein [Chloroflexaceae bacterium]